MAIWGLRNLLVPIGGDIIEVVSPFKGGTTAGRLLEKRGDGGYMIIMQNRDGPARRAYIEQRGLAKVIWKHSHTEHPHPYHATQYHPKGIKGGMMPELDSMQPTPDFPRPMIERFSPWGACGPDFESYGAGMQQAWHLRLRDVRLQLAPGDSDVAGAVAQWTEIFGIPTSGGELAFTNATMGFVKGEQGKPEGLDLITVQVSGKGHFDGILQRAREEGVCGDGWINLCGVRWYFVDASESKEKL